MRPALEDSSLYLVCPYDTETVDPEVIAEAHHSHPLIVDGSGDRSSSR